MSKVRNLDHWAIAFRAQVRQLGHGWTVRESPKSGRVTLKVRGATEEAVSKGSTIALNVLVMNLEKLLELFFVFFTALLLILLVKEGGRSIRTVPLKPQIASA